MALSEVFQVGPLHIHLLVASKQKTHQTKPRPTNPTMKSDSLARRAILFVTFIIATTILYGFTTKVLFTAPNYDDVSIDPEGGSYYDYGSKVAAAVWKGAGDWIGMTESAPTDNTVDPERSSKNATKELQIQGLEMNLTVSDALDSKPIFVISARREGVTRKRRSPPHRGHP